MKKFILACCIASQAIFPVAGTASLAHAQSEASAVGALSGLPIASVAGATAVAGSVAAIPLALTVSGAVLVVKAVDSTARGTVYVLERASDGARASVEIASQATGSALLAAGTALTVSTVGAGVVLSMAGQAIAFIPNAIGKALLHNERLTR